MGIKALLPVTLKLKNSFFAKNDAYNVVINESNALNFSQPLSLVFWLRKVTAMYCGLVLRMLFTRDSLNC